jgi:ABC-type nitrate/sulfonate/bicarbonate transport system substrate-binding protein
MPISGYFALRSTVQKDPNTIAAFQAALTEAQSLGVQPGAGRGRADPEQVSHEVAATTSIGNYPTADRGGHADQRALADELGQPADLGPERGLADRTSD